MKYEPNTLHGEFVASTIEAARRANIELLPGDIALSVQGDHALANAFIAPPKDVPLEQARKLFFLYLSFPEDSEMARKVPSGYYTVERLEDQTSPRAKIVNMAGNTVMEVPLHIIKWEFLPEQYPGASPYQTHQPDIPSKEPVTFAQAIIEQSRETLYRIKVYQAHGIICYPLAGVWYWTWVIIVVRR